MGNGNAVLEKRLRSLVDGVLVRKISGLTKAVERIKFNADIDLVVQRRGSIVTGVGGVDVGTGLEIKVRRSKSQTTCNILAQDITRNVKRQERVHTSSKADLGADRRVDALERGVEGSDALAKGYSLAIRNDELGSKDGANTARDVTNSKLALKSDFRLELDNAANLELAKRELLNDNRVSKERGLDGGRDCYANSKLEVHAVRGECRSREARLGRDGDVGVQAAVAATVLALNNEMGRADISLVKDLVVCVFKAELDLLGDALALADELGAGDVHISVLDKVVPVVGSNNRKSSSIAIIRNVVDVVGRAALDAAAASSIGEEDERVGSILLDPRPSRLSLVNGGGGVEGDDDALWVGAVNGLDEVSKEMLIQKTVLGECRDGDIGKEA